MTRSRTPGAAAVARAPQGGASSSGLFAGFRLAACPKRGESAEVSVRAPMVADSVPSRRPVLANESSPQNHRGWRVKWQCCLLLLISLPAFLLAGHVTRGSEPATSPATLDSGGPLMKEQAAYDVQQYDLSLAIDPGAKSIAGTATIEVKILDPISWLVLDLDPRLKVSRVQLLAPPGLVSTNGAHFEQRGSQLWVSLNQLLAVGTRLTAAIAYSGQPRETTRAPWDGGFTWSKTKSGQPWIATSVQGEGADLWWPCKDHPSDKPESFTLRIRVPVPLVVAANGRLIEVIPHADGTRTYHWHTAFPISN
ncbi:MAG: hypothetical protein NT154_16150, partial [Verrucomicrobia bacterium]|nr:hypothetical protein [Verrucomicrobiota bacterium]